MLSPGEPAPSPNFGGCEPAITANFGCIIYYPIIDPVYPKRLPAIVVDTPFLF